MMFCKNCGAQLEDSVTFCTQCGNRLEKPTPAAEADFSAEEVVPVSPFAETKSAPPMSGTVLPPPAAASEPVREKTFFGIGALVFCLVIIGALSISTGVFAGLYFHLAAQL